MKPLSGLRIIEFDGLGPVTFAGMMLADLGAEVLRLTRSAAAGTAAFSEVGRGPAPGPSSHCGEPQGPGRPRPGHGVDRCGRCGDRGLPSRVMEQLGLGPSLRRRQSPPRLRPGRRLSRAGRMAQQVGRGSSFASLSGALRARPAPDRPPRPPLNLVSGSGSRGHGRGRGRGGPAGGEDPTKQAGSCGAPAMTNRCRPADQPVLRPAGPRPVEITLTREPICWTAGPLAVAATPAPTAVGRRQGTGARVLRPP